MDGCCTCCWSLLFLISYSLLPIFHFLFLIFFLMNKKWMDGCGTCCWYPAADAWSLNPLHPIPSFWISYICVLYIFIYTCTVYMYIQCIYSVYVYKCVYFHIHLTRTCTYMCIWVHIRYVSVCTWFACIYADVSACVKTYLYMCMGAWQKYKLNT